MYSASDVWQYILQNNIENIDIVIPELVHRKERMLLQNVIINNNQNDGYATKQTKARHAKSLSK